MTPSEIKEAERSFMAERVAIMVDCGMLSEKDAAAKAQVCWIKYCLDNGIEWK